MEISIRTPVADATGGTTFNAGEPSPIVDAKMASSLPFVPEAIIAPAEFSMAERNLTSAGCGTLTVVTLNKSSSKVDLLLIEKAPDRDTLKTHVLAKSADIVAEANTPFKGLTIRPCAGLGNVHPAPTRLMTRTEGANAVGMFMIFGIKEMLMVVKD